MKLAEDISLVKLRHAARSVWASARAAARSVRALLAHGVDGARCSATPTVMKAGTASVRFDGLDHAVACAAYIVGYPIVLIWFLNVGVFDFLMPNYTYSVIDILIEPDLHNRICSQSPGCNLAAFAYYLVPLEITRRVIKKFFHPAAYPPFPILVFGSWRRWALLVVHFVLLFLAIAFSHDGMVGGSGRDGYDAFFNAAWVGFIVAAGLATRHSIRIRKHHEKSEASGKKENQASP